MKLIDSLIELHKAEQKSGIRALDAELADASNETRVALDCELEALRKAKNKLKSEVNNGEYCLLIKEVA